jgi:hypothetical protein
MAVRLLSNQNVNGDIDVNHSQNAITYVAVTNTDTGVAANSRMQVVGESSQLDMIATSAGYTGVTGWADAGIITTDSGASGGLKLNSQAGGIQLQIGTTSHFYLATTGNVGINDAGAAATSLSVKDTQDSTFTSGISVIRSANSDVGYINMVGGAFNLNSTKNTKLRVSDVTKLEVKSNGINVIGKTETDTLLSTGAAQFDTTAQIGSDTTATPELLTVQAYSHNEAFSGKSSATNYIWFLRNENDSGRFQLYNSSGTNTIEFTGADGAATFAGDVALTGGSLSITGDGSNAATLTESGAGILTIAAVDDLILDSGSDISLDAGGNDIRLKVNGIEYAKFKDDSDDLAMFSSIQDKDILFKGNDGGSTITALTLDMSNGGSATFRDDIDLGGKLTQTGTGENRFYGNVEFDKNVWQDISTNGGYIMRPNGADYVTTTGAVTGAIEIRIPTGGTGKDDMIKFVVDIYDYATQESITVFIGGYIYQAIGGTTWTNVSAQIIATDSSKNYKVRFGDNGSVHCVWIGETDSTWSYPQILVRDFYGGFATTVEDYLATWDITYVTSFTTVSNTLTNNFPMSHGGTDDAFWSASGANIYNDNAGNVGIGTTTPSVPLHVARATTGTTFRLQQTGSNLYTEMQFSTPTGNMYIFVNSTGFTSYGGANSTNFYTSNGAFAFHSNAGNNHLHIANGGNVGNRTGALYFSTSNAGAPTEKMRITSAGNVGIGTTSPETGLHLYGTSNTASNFTIEQVYSGTSKKFGFQPVYNDDRLDFWYNSNATVAMTIKDGGNVGIGTTSPTGKLNVEAAGNHLHLRANTATAGKYWNFDITANNQLFIINNGGTGMTIKDDGNVGINNTSPGQKLTVTGDGSGTSDVVRITHGNGSHTGSGLSIRSANTGKAIYVDGSVGAGFAEITTAYNANPNIRTSGDVVAYASSDKRFKDNLKVIQNPIDKIHKLNGYTFDWNDKQDVYKGKDYGVVAQEVEKVMPELVDTRFDGYKAVKYEKLVPLLIESIKELKAEIEELKKNK